MVRIGPMARAKSLLDRRETIAGLGAAALAPLWPATGLAQGRPSLSLQAKVGSLALRAGPATPIWSLQGPELRFQRGDTVEVSFGNELPVPAVLDWRGIDGVPAAEPLTVRAPLATGGKQAFQLPLRHAGTFLCDLRLLGDAQGQPSQARALVVRESEAVAVDRDEVLLIEDWRIRADGAAIAPGAEPRDAAPVLTINGRTSLELSARLNERVRLRIINSCQRSVIAFKIEGAEVRVMAIDSQPSEPFQARNGTVVMAPGGRVDAFVDVTAAAGTAIPMLLHDGKEARTIGKLTVASEPPIRQAPLPAAPPLPSNGLPERLELKGATRVDLPLGGPPGDWVTPASFSRHRPARLPRQGRPRRGAGPDQPRRHRHGIPPPWSSLPAAGPARRRLEAVLAGYAGDRTRPDPADRLSGRVRRALADRIRRYGLGGAPAYQVVRCRVRRPA